MTLFLLDPNLDHPNGHHLDWDLAIAQAAEARGERAVILAHRDYPATEAAGIEIRPWFTFTTYQSAATDPLTARYDDFRLFNDRLAMDLAALPAGTFRAADAVLAPTLTEQHLRGYATWMKGFDPARAPLFALHLMFPPGPEEMVAMLYRLALREVDRPGPPIHLFATGQERAAEFSELLGRPVPAHPLPLAPARAARRAPDARPSCLLFLGDAKAEKGVALLPAVAERLAQRHRGWDFAIHLNEATAWGEARDTLADLRALAQHQPNLALHTEWLDRAAYERFLDAADALVCLHDPAVYGRKSSGILWEAVSIGLSLVLPRGTWLEREAAAWGAGFVACTEYDVAGICGAFAHLAEGHDALAEAAEQAAARFRAENGAARTVGQLWPLWRAGLVAGPAASTALDGLAGAAAAPEPGAAATWMGHEAEVAFPWPPGTPFQFEVTTDLAVRAEFGAGAEFVLLSDGHDHRSGQLRFRFALRRQDLALVAAPPAARAAVSEAAPEVPPDGFANRSVQAQVVRVDELLALEDAEYRHLDLSLFDLVSGGIRWPQVKFRLCHDRGRSYLEFRRMAGWPDMFVNWPGSERDRFGDVLKVPADATPLPPCAPDDTALFRALTHCLGDVVTTLAGRHPEHADEWRTWSEEALVHERTLAARLRAAPVATQP